MKIHQSHVTRPSDSSLYDEVCVLCGETDATNDLELPCVKVETKEVICRPENVIDVLRDLAYNADSENVQRVLTGLIDNLERHTLTKVCLHVNEKMRDD